ncbi:acetyltransferase [Vibrio cholerae]
MVAVVVFEFSGMRCQPLRRALYAKEVFNEISYTIIRYF